MKMGLNKFNLVVCLMVVCTVVHAAPQYRDFMDTEGRTIRGRIIAFDGKADIVTIERDTKRTAKVPVAI